MAGKKASNKPAKGGALNKQMGHSGGSIHLNPKGPLAKKGGYK
jgi:hypothetical protein